MSTGLASPPVTPADVNRPGAALDDRFANIETFRPYFDGLYNAFTTSIIPAVEDARASRMLDIDVLAMRADGTILPHQTVVAQRIIDINISRELPDLVAYLTQARRLAIFEPNDKATPRNTNYLEEEFRRVMTYEGWITPYMRVGDCGKCHGWGAADCSYDPTQPGAVSVEYISAGDLFFDIRVACVQQAPLVARRYEITSVDLLEYASEYEFLAEPVDELMRKLVDLEKQPASTPAESNYIYRIFYKKNKKVHAGWYSKDLGKFLALPQPFYNGVMEDVPEVPVPPVNDPAMPTEPVIKRVKFIEEDYPFHIYRSRITEDPAIVRTPGHAALDFYLQEAATAMWSAFVNGTIEASMTMWSPTEGNPDRPTAPKQLSLLFEHGKVWDSPMQAFHAPYPEAALPKALEMLRSQNAEDTNQINFAVNNRRDTRKTATEIEAAAAQDSQMSSVSVTTWATFIGSVCNQAWRIIQSQALDGNIVFCPANMPDPATGQIQQGNDIELIRADYKIIPAGTVDYVERVEQIASMQSDWPIIGPTPAGPVFLEEYIRLKYPTIANKLIAPLQQAQQAGEQVAQAMLPLLQEAVTDENGVLLPEWQPQAAVLQKLGVQVAMPGAPEQPQPQPTQS